MCTAGSGLQGGALCHILSVITAARVAKDDSAPLPRLVPPLMNLLNQIMRPGKR